MDSYGNGKQVYIRKLSEEDYSVYREVNYSRSLFKNIFDDKWMQRIWKMANVKDILVCAVIEKVGKEICGFCQLDKIDMPIPYIGIHMRDGYMGKGYAQEVARLLIDYASKHFFNSDTNEFDSCGYVDMTSGYLAPLVNAMIIYQATKVGHGVGNWAFNLQSNVRIYLNKAVKSGKIVVPKNGEYKWNL